MQRVVRGLGTDLGAGAQPPVPFIASVAVAARKPSRSGESGWPGTIFWSRAVQKSPSHPAPRREGWRESRRDGPGWAGR